MILRDSMAGGLEEGRLPSVQPRAACAVPTVIRRVLRLPQITGRAPRIALFDAQGRQVLNLHPGENDLSRLAPGAYFVRAENPVALPTGFRSVTKLVLTD